MCVCKKEREKESVCVCVKEQEIEQGCQELVTEKGQILDLTK